MVEKGHKWKQRSNKSETDVRKHSQHRRADVLKSYLGAGH